MDWIAPTPPLLVICGPTATGKTSLALQLAKKFKGELISADSRQVYRGMDIGTGKDVAELIYQRSKIIYQGKHLGYYKDGGVRLWGYDVVEPNQDWHVAVFFDLASLLIKDIFSRQKLPVVVGGTGFYLQNLAELPMTIGIAPNKKLRQRLEKLSIIELKKHLKQLDAKRFISMNQSDRNNPRRLIRAIEVAPVIRSRSTRSASRMFTSTGQPTLWVGLRTSLTELDRRIEKRVKKRIKQGAETEVKKLVKKYGWNSVLSETIGYQEWKPYFAGKVTRNSVIANWITHEKQYARRQLTWFKKQPDIHWFNVTDSKYPKNVEARVKRWYDEKNE
jgi:tRNA dimethylallyltransferase